MTIQEIKVQLTMARVLSHYNLSPNKQNMLCCPFHPDKTPSMQIYPATNTAFCFSSNCQLQGKSIDTIDFILYKEQCSKHEALLKAKVLLGQHLIQTVTSKTTRDYTTLFQDFKTALIRSKKAIDYIKTRHIYDIKLEIGYNNGTIYNQLKNCLIFPLKDSNHEIVSFYGRSITDHPEQRHFYLSNRKGLYPGYPKPDTSKIILTESIIDATTLLKYTDHPVLALYGTNGLTQEHLTALQSLTHLNEVIFFFDGDAAGWEATQKYSIQLHQVFPETTISKVNIPDNEDVNSLIQGHKSDILDHLIAARTTIFSFSTENITESSIEKVEWLDMPLPKPTSSPLNTSQPAILGNVITIVFYFSN
jgi:DNA primase